MTVKPWRIASRHSEWIEANFAWLWATQLSIFHREIGSLSRKTIRNGRFGTPICARRADEQVFWLVLPKSLAPGRQFRPCIEVVQVRLLALRDEATGFLADYLASRKPPLISLTSIFVRLFMVLGRGTSGVHLSSSPRIPSIAEGIIRRAELHTKSRAPKSTRELPALVLSSGARKSCRRPNVLRLKEPPGDHVRLRGPESPTDQARSADVVRAVRHYCERGDLR